MSERIDEFVEEKILKITFRAKNFSKEEMDTVDEYCKENYDNNRKLMVLDLIRYKEENIPIIILNDKINFLYEKLNIKIKSLEKEPDVSEKDKKTWKGFSESKE